MKKLFLKLLIISSTIFFLFGCKNQGSISDISKDACDKWFASKLDTIYKKFDKGDMLKEVKEKEVRIAEQVLSNCKTILFNKQRAKSKDSVQVQLIDTTVREEIIENENFNNNLMSLIEQKANKIDPENNMESKEIEVAFTVSRYNNSSCPTDKGCKLIKIGKNSNCLCPLPRP